MPTISVIVPVYNVEPYLHRCVDSILGQTFTDFELILVDDGSPDGCPAICDEYAVKDSRIVVIHQENGGLSAARNAGLDWAFANSDSRWISFVDSDDWVHPEYLERLLDAALAFGVGISICGYVETDGASPEIVEADCIPNVWEPERFFVEHTVNATIAGGKLYQKECFRDILYPVGKLHEDEYTTYRIIFNNDALVWIDAPLYFYYHNPNSITTSEWSPRRMDVIVAFDEQMDYFTRHGYSGAMNRRIRSYLWMLNSQYYGAVSAKQDYTSEIRQLRTKMKNILQCYVRQIDRTWPEYAAISEIVHPIRSRVRSLMHRTYGNHIKKTIIALWEKIYSSDIVLSAVYRWNHRNDRLNIMTPEETIEYIIQHKCSIARFGDGEFELVLQPDIDLGFQNRSSALSARLEDVLTNQSCSLLVCIPLSLNTIQGRTKHSRMFWYSWSRRNDQHHRIVDLIRAKGNGNYRFGDSQITRGYLAFLNDQIARKIFHQMQKLWDNRDLMIVEGEMTRMGIGNDLFSNARSIKRILCPATNAFDCYDAIIDTVRSVWNGELILLALGPTATVLASDFSNLGMQALDIGHVDIEYEWFLRGVKGHEQVPGKFTNEAAGRNTVESCDDAQYIQQIIRKVL